MIGQQVSHYRITDKLGEGGMGVVYRAEDVRLERPVAIKFLPPSLSDHPQARARLLREAKAASALEHPNICSIFEIDDTDDGRMFMVMPCYEGETLQQRLERGPLPVQESLDVGRQLASALAATHARGIVHRDIKPGNIMLTGDGTQAVLMDFGLAKPDDATQITRTGAAVGTISYMSPEQVRGEPADSRSDLWSLGVVLYEMSTGQRPFLGGGERAVFESILHEPAAPASTVNPEVTPAFAAMIDTLLEKSPERRQSAADEVGRLLDEHQRLIADLDAPVSWRFRQWRRRHRVALRFSTAVVVVAAGLAAWGLWPAHAEIHGLAVLPFTDLSSEGDQGWFCDGMTDALISSLGEAGIPRVISRTSVQRYKETELSIPEIASELDADVIVEASVLQAEGNVRISARLVQGETEEQLWSGNFERELSGILQLHAEIARLITEQIRVALDPSALARLENRQTVDPDAFRLLLRGKQALYSGISAAADSSGWEGMRRNFEEALAIDPSLAPAWAGLAEWYVRNLHGGASPDEVIPAARAALNRALEIDPDLQPAYVTRAHLLWEHEWKQDEAAEAFRRAIELNPSDAYARLLFSYYAMANRHFDEAADAMLLAIRLDPFNKLAWEVAGAPLRRAERFEEALVLFDQREERFPEMRAVFYARTQTYWYMGRREDSIALLQEFPAWQTWNLLMPYLMEMDRPDEARAVGEEALSQFTEMGYPEHLPSLALAQAILGDRTEALASLAEHGEVTGPEAMGVARVHLFLGDLDRCFAFLEQAYQFRDIWLPRINCRPWWYDPLHEDPRFQDLVARMGLSS